jgi:superfamily II DNA or RNA helicase
MFRQYQHDQEQRIYGEWRKGHRNVLSVIPTGGGKTVIISNIFRNCDVPGIVIAHRQELIAQISLSLAMGETYHAIIAPAAIIAFIVERHVEEFGKSFYQPSSQISVASIDTLIKRDFPNPEKIKIWQTDEGHHLLEKNKWSRGIDQFVNAYGVGHTASGMRPDRNGLGRGHGGLYDALVIGPSHRELIGMGYLCEYRIVAPKPSMDRTRIDVSKTTGDFKPDSMRAEAHRSTITGDVVATYQKFTPGKQGLTFAVDVGLAEEHAAGFRSIGVPAEVITNKTKNTVRRDLLADYRCGLIKQISSVDIFGEGFDCPAVEVVSMARPTQSLIVFDQQFGRASRIKDGKNFGWILDHVGNVEQHRLPDDRRHMWTLEAPEGRTKTRSSGPPVRTCENLDCLAAFESWSQRCPYCGTMPKPSEASRPEQVEGDLMEFGAELLEQLRKSADEAVRTAPNRAPGSARNAVIFQNMDIRAAAQHELRGVIDFWAGVRTTVYGDDLSSAYRRFYGTFGIDAFSAQSLGAAEASKLTKMIREELL